MPKDERDHITVVISDADSEILDIIKIAITPGNEMEAQRNLRDYIERRFEILDDA